MTCSFHWHTEHVRLWAQLSLLRIQNPGCVMTCVCQAYLFAGISACRPTMCADVECLCCSAWSCFQTLVHVHAASKALRFLVSIYQFKSHLASLVAACWGPPEDTALSVCYYMPNDVTLADRSQSFFQQAGSARAFGSLHFDHVMIRLLVSNKRRSSEGNHQIKQNIEEQLSFASILPN